MANRRYLINSGSVLMSDGTRHGVGSVVELDDDVAASMHGRIECVDQGADADPVGDVHVIGAPAADADDTGDVR